MLVLTNMNWHSQLDQYIISPFTRGYSRTPYTKKIFFVKTSSGNSGNYQ